MKKTRYSHYYSRTTSLLFGFYCLTAGAQEAGITIAHVDQLPMDPLAEIWQQASIYEAAVLAQQMAMPALANTSIEKIEVQALTDGTSIAWRLSWEDAQANIQIDTGHFSDAVALEFPLTEGAAPMMGNQGAKVQLLYWKALWQNDKDNGFQDVQDVYPNYWSDLYWFAEGQFPYRVPDAFQNPIAQQWFIAHQAGNPMADFSREQPVQELIAEGWGTLTPQAEAVTMARGSWQDGIWSVMFSRPLVTGDPNDYQFGAAGQVALAVWQGEDANSGGRKHWSNWIAYQMQP